ncbi:hypothetical protein JAAARDRAFT_201149 [Jaapia argillacea MUCL 33604]|uniref:Uncharacterized protein n=1 Tax=Jaapia argillacea MUCL 33604 TaxID=933084 RepID=A0A067P2V3_9AGAM|nr:hypothetical protein JAAARDRAFT_201149 [Jaapia argillacea MUCL 33604]
MKSDENTNNTNEIYKSEYVHNKLSFAKENTKHKQALTQYEKDLRNWQQREERHLEEAQKASGSNSAKKKKQPSHKEDPQPVPPQQPLPRMHQDKPELFLQFAAAIKIILGWTIDEQAILRALQLLQEYLLQFHEIYGKKAMKPNHHWVIHLPNQIRDYGPIYGFWLFVTERLNKTLKNYNTNHWTGGQLEISLMHAFGRENHLKSMVSYVAGFPDEISMEGVIAKRMLERKGEDRGTMEAVAFENAAIALEGMKQLYLYPFARSYHLASWIKSACPSRSLNL